MQVKLYELLSQLLQQLLPRVLERWDGSKALFNLWPGGMLMLLASKISIYMVDEMVAIVASALGNVAATTATASLLTATVATTTALHATTIATQTL